MFKTLVKTSLMLLLSLSWAEAVIVSNVTQFTTDLLSRTINIGTDNKDNFIAVFNDAGVVYGTNSIAGTMWTLPVPLSTGDAGICCSDVAMDQTSTGLAIWSVVDGGNYDLFTSFYSGGVWTPILTPLDSIVFFQFRPSIAMNGMGQGIAGWNDPNVTEARASFFNAGVWSPFQVIGVGNGGMDVAYSPNGTAVASWVHFDLGISDLWANIFNGIAWIGPTLLDAAAGSFPDVGIDANGHAFVIWRADSDTNIKVSRFNGVSWSTPVILSSAASGFVDPKIAVDLDGTAIAVFVDISGTLFYSKFNGAAWQAPVPFANSLNDLDTLGITMDDQGDALIAWAAPGNQLFAALFPKNGVLQPPVFIRQAVRVIGGHGGGGNLEPALSSLSTLGSIVWTEGFDEGESDSFGVFIAFAPTPPTNLVGTTCITGFDRVNIIKWTPSIDPTVVSYNVYRDDILIATVPATGPFAFFDHNRCTGVPSTYAVTAVNDLGIESTPVTITLN